MSVDQQWLLAAAIVLGLIPAAIARRKERSFLGWWAFGFLIWPVALIASVIVDNPYRYRCPYCAEQVRAEATVCPHCRRELD